ncbi:ferredoxin--NADP(+) reductase [Candidatus Riesia pediculicola]|nr:ferredoxin--NADP(+) reductase [Candidatus Riesia pediculicola]ARC53854.1 ferredoxin-NADP reductase [Candidatus Riesia pediculicola]QOJ86670.1 ferredoxin--NADP(+) reductase [Candidatus Riesia pediculicola]
MKSWSIGKITEKNSWENFLFSLSIEASVDPFIAGQFTKLALLVNGKFIQKPYSYVNPPNSKNLEFYLVNTQSIGLSKELFNLKIGDAIYVRKKSIGNLTLQKIPDRKVLWMLSTGTAIGPFLSILRFKNGLERFNKIVLVHAVRYSKDLNYLSLMKQLEKEYSGKLILCTVVSREKVQDMLFGRIPYLIQNGNLENFTEVNLDPKDSHVMICGNPEMIKDTIKILEKEKNLKKCSNEFINHITFEQYW